MLPLSIVILTKNEERNIARCLLPLQGLTDDIVVVDSESTDNTIAIATAMGAKVMTAAWQGYAKTKNEANRAAKYEWILSVDADEEVNEELRSAVLQLFSGSVSEKTAYLIRRKMVYCGSVLNHGAVANEYRLRLFNKKNARWNEKAVHEDIELNSGVELRKLNGFMWHHSYNTTGEHEKKIELYAQLFAKQKLMEGRKFSFVKTRLSPAFGFIKNYIFRLGFLDGIRGYQFAKTEMKYTSRKYELAQK